MNLKAAFLALALSLPFAAASATVSSIASADPITATQAAKPAPKALRVGEGSPVSAPGVSAPRGLTAAGSTARASTTRVVTAAVRAAST